MRNLLSLEETNNFLGIAQLLDRNGTTRVGSKDGGRQPVPGSQGNGDEKAGTGDTMSLRGWQSLGEDGERGNGQQPLTGKTRVESRQGGNGSVLHPGPFSRYLLEVPVDRMQVVLEVRDEGLLPALQRLLVPHPILQTVEHPAHAGAQRLDGTDGLGKGL